MQVCLRARKHTQVFSDGKLLALQVHHPYMGIAVLALQWCCAGCYDLPEDEDDGDEDDADRDGPDSDTEGVSLTGGAGRLGGAELGAVHTPPGGATSLPVPGASQAV
jgi:hypothetical protein